MFTTNVFRRVWSCREFVLYLGKTFKMEQEIKSVCEQLREVRNASGFSLDVVCERANLDKSTVSKYERGLLVPKPATIGKWANVLGCEVRVSLERVPSEGQLGSTR